MTNRRLLFVSIAILITTTIIVAVFGIVPLPNYEDLASENNFDGKLIYYVERQSENIIPPAPDIVDSCIFYIDKIVVSYWDYQAGDERKNLIVDIESGEISEDVNKSFFTENNRMNVYGEKLIDPWETSDYNSRVIGVYYADRIKNIEVFSSRAPSNYYFESFHWSPDGNNIIAGDSENNLIIFSKNKSFNPFKIEINTNLQDGDKLELVQVLGWTN